MKSRILFSLIVLVNISYAVIAQDSTYAGTLYLIKAGDPASVQKFPIKKEEAKMPKLTKPANTGYECIVDEINKEVIIKEKDANGNITEKKYKLITK